MNGFHCKGFTMLKSDRTGCCFEENIRFLLQGENVVVQFIDTISTRFRVYGKGQRPNAESARGKGALVVVWVWMTLCFRSR